MLLYVEIFKPLSTSLGQERGTKQLAHVTEDDIELFKVVKDKCQDGQMRGAVVPLSAVWCAIQLIPCFGRTCPPGWGSRTSMESAESFFVNTFDTKETYQTVY